MFLFPAIVSLYQFLFFAFYMKYDSPQYYYSRDMIKETEEALAYTHTKDGMGIGLDRVKHEIAGKTLHGHRLSMLSMITKRRFSKMTRMAIILPIILQMCGITAIYFYSTIIFDKLGGSLFFGRIITVIGGIVNVFSSIFSIFLLKCFGRKVVLILGTVLLAVDLYLLGVFSDVVGNQMMIAVFLIGFYVPFGFSYGATFWVYTAEILNDQIMSLAVVVSFAISIIVSFTFPVAISNVGVSVTFYFFSICMVASAIYSAFELIETKGKNKDVILFEMKVIEQPVTNDIELPDDHPSENENEDDVEDRIVMREISHNEKFIDDEKNGSIFPSRTNPDISSNK